MRITTTKAMGIKAGKREKGSKTKKIIIINIKTSAVLREIDLLGAFDSK